MDVRFSQGAYCLHFRTLAGFVPNSTKELFHFQLSIEPGGNRWKVLECCVLLIKITLSHLLNCSGVFKLPELNIESVNMAVTLSLWIKP